MNRQSLSRISVLLLIAGFPAVQRAYADKLPQISLRGSIAYAESGVLHIRDLESGEIINVPTSEFGEHRIPVGVIKPLGFSPDGRSLAAHVARQSNHIDVFSNGFRDRHWVTSTLTIEKLGGRTYYWNSLAACWSPDNRSLAVSSWREGVARVSVWDGDTLRTVHEYETSTPASQTYLMAWSRDGKILYLAPPTGPEPCDLIAAPYPSGGPVVVYHGSEKSPFRDPAWDPKWKALALAAGKSLVLYDGNRAVEAWQAPTYLRALSWSPDSRRLALLGGAGEVYIVARDGGEAWAVTDSISEKWFTPNAVWVDSATVAFVLITRRSEPSVYLANAVTRTVTRLPLDDIVVTNLVAVPGQVAFAFLQVSDRSPWEKKQSKWGDHRTRRVQADLRVYDAASGSVRPVRWGDKIPGEEDEGNYGVNLYPALDLR